MIRNIFETAPWFILTHPYLLGVAGALLTTVGLIVIVRHKLTARRAEARTVELTALFSQLAPASEPDHEVHCGYDGEGVYAWRCKCGDAGTDFPSLDGATIAGTVHLDEHDAIPAVQDILGLHGTRCPEHCVCNGTHYARDRFCRAAS